MQPAARDQAPPPQQQPPPPGPPLKRARMRTTSVATVCTFVAAPMLRGFAQALLFDAAFKRALHGAVRWRGAAATVASAEDAAADADLAPIPLRFESAQAYAETFQGMILEEARTEVLGALESAGVSSAVPRIGFTMRSRVGEELDDDTNGTADPQRTRYCRLRTLDFRLPERGEERGDAGGWKRAEKQQMVRLSTDACAPVGLSPLTRGDVLILTGSPMFRRNNRFETTATWAAFAIVSRPARPCQPGSGSPGALDIEVVVETDVAATIRDVDVVAYHVSDCNLVTAWREWDGLKSLVTSQRQVAWTSPLIAPLLCGGGDGKISRSTSPTMAASSSSSSSSIPNGGGGGGNRVPTPPPPPAAASAAVPTTNPSQPDKDKDPPLLDTFNVVAVDPKKPLNLAGATPLYQDQLLQRFNSSQIDAIAAACSTKSGFVLVQGPPGTGKTTTLLGLLNTLHLSVNQEYYDKALPDPYRTDNQIKTGPFDWVKDRSNPHLLVAAPSNAAIDNVLRLVTSKGFIDGVGNTYIPSCVRIGSATWNNNSSNSSSNSATSTTTDDVYHACSLDHKVEELLRSRRGTDAANKKSETDALVSRLRGLESEVRRLNKILVDLANEHAKTRDFEVLKMFHAIAGEWVGYRNRARDVALDLERRRLLFGSGGGGDSALRADLRMIVLSQANLVFATLSQCGSSIMTEMAPAQISFQVLIVDEAAQAVESSTVVPMNLGVERCVMVGDPSQLPATVLSERAAKARFQQSLFERLQRCGHPVHLLDVQYRCRPELSMFSSRMFYGNRLHDGANVQNPAYRLAMHRFRAFGPLVFFDVSYGEHVKSSVSSSYLNEAEASVCVELYRAMRDALRADSVSPTTKAQAQIAVISPYREQLSLLSTRFGKAAQGDALLEMNTVDGFQGREVDVVIFSCVRGYQGEGGGNSIGFLNDARRLNVAVTRARFSLLIVGNSNVLRRGSRLWRSLLEHVQEKGTIINVPHAGFDFLNVV